MQIVCVSTTYMILRVCASVCVHIVTEYRQWVVSLVLRWAWTVSEKKWKLNSKNFMGSNLGKYPGERKYLFVMCTMIREFEKYEQNYANNRVG